MKLEKLDPNLQELNTRETLSINGGESIWYWIFYGIGSIPRHIYETQAIIERENIRRYKEGKLPMPIYF